MGPTKYLLDGARFPVWSASRPTPLQELLGADPDS